MSEYNYLAKTSKEESPYWEDDAYYCLLFYQYLGKERKRCDTCSCKCDVLEAM